MRSYQELFDDAVVAAIKQGRPSVDAHGRCCYRGPDGLKCAVGHLIPDENYDPQMESCSIYGGQDCSLFECFPEAIGQPVDDETLVLLVLLQVAHDMLDSVDYVGEFKRNAKIVANDFELEWKHG